MRRKFDRI